MTTKRSVLFVAFAGAATTTAGLTWMFGPIALTVCGVAMLVSAFFIDY